MSITWNTGSAAERFRSRAQKDAAQFNLRLKKKKKIKKATSLKLQAASFKHAPRKRHNYVIKKKLER